jgi:multiple sugar transport system substrate-binding protein
MAAENPSVPTSPSTPSVPGIVRPILPNQPFIPPPLSHPTMTQVNIPSSTPPASSAAFTTTSFPKSKRNLIFIIGIILLVVILGVVGFSLLGKVGIGGKTTLTWWNLWEDESIVAPLISEYEKDHPNIKISYVKQSKEDYRERLTNALAKGTGPDIFSFHNTWVPMFKSELDYIPASVMSAADYTKVYYPVISSDMANGTGLVGLPLEYDGLTLFINEDIFNKAGKTPPTTWNDLTKVACDLTVIDNGTILQSGVALGRTENVDHWPEILALMMLQNGVDLANPTGKSAEDALSYFAQFSSNQACEGQDKKVWDETLPVSSLAFSAGKLAMYFGPSWRAFGFLERQPNLKFRTVPLPQLPKENAGEPSISYATYWAEGVWSRSKEKQAAWDFLKFLSTKESLTKLYANAVKSSPNRVFGEPYPRVDMGDLLLTDPLVGSVISQAPDARSWYMMSSIYDGPTGINSQINKYFEDAINGVNSGKISPTKALEPVASGVAQILSQYGLVSK